MAKEKQPNEGFRFNEEDLVILRDELYDGSWELFLQDLENRLKRRPAVFRITARIKEDIETIKRLMKEEQEEKEKKSSKNSKKK